MIESLQRLAQAMLVGASLGCEQIQQTYARVLGMNPDGSSKYGFCAIGFANIGVLGYVPDSLENEAARRGEQCIGRELLTRELGVDWCMWVPLPDGRQEWLLTVISFLNDYERWTVPRIAAWTLMCAAGWTIREGDWCHPCENTVVKMGKYTEIVAALEEAHLLEPEHPCWRQVVHPAWWREKL